MRKSTKRTLIYIRYILPPVIMLIIPLFMLIPSYQYVVAGDLKETISAWTLLGDNFSSSRQALFGSGEFGAGDIFFAKTFLALEIIFGIIVFHLGCKLGFVGGAVEVANEVHTTHARLERGEILLDVVAEGVDGAKTCDYHSSIFHNLRFQSFT